MKRGFPNSKYTDIIISLIIVCQVVPEYKRYYFARLLRYPIEIGVGKNLV